MARLVFAQQPQHPIGADRRTIKSTPGRGGPVRVAAPSKTIQDNFRGLKPSFRDPFAQFVPEPWQTANLPVEESTTPPSSWYNSPDVWEYQKQAIFGRQWTFAGNSHTLKKPGDFMTGKIADNSFVVVMDKDGQLKAFHNVCRHHAAPVASGTGCIEKFACPYHGWEYDLNGTFRGATQMQGIKNFYAADQALWPIRLDTFGPLMFLLFSNDESEPGIRETFGTALPRMVESGQEANDLVWVHQDTYKFNCNWMVFNDNYLDGCYHCGFAHPSLSAALDMDGYHTEAHERVSFQLADPVDASSVKEGDQLWQDVISSRIEVPGVGPTYSFIYPNVMINRYSVWMDTLHVIPTSHNTCICHIDYWVPPSKVEDKEWIRGVVAGEDLVQREDLALCDLVQEGIQSPAYDVGRYAPGPESIMHHFHQLVNKDLFRPL